MVKKLFRHEIAYYFRTFGLFLPIVLAVSVVTRVFLLFDNGNILNKIAIFSSSAMLFVSCMALTILASAVAVIRFYKNMYTAEGYLTFTLPVTNTQHILVKLLCALLCQATAVLTVIIAIVIASSGEPLSTLFGNLSLIVNELSVMLGGGNLVAFAIEGLLLLLLAAASNMLLFYTCITIGQLAKKNRILMAIGAYFIYYVASQVLSTVFTIVFTVISMTTLLDGIMQWVVMHFALATHLYFGILILFSAALSVAFFLITRGIMTKKLNLE